MNGVLECPACAATVRVIGQLRAPSTSALRRAITGLLHDGERHILLDLEALTDVDSAGISELVNVSNMTTSAGGTLRIARARTSVRRLLDEVGDLRILEDGSAPSVDANVNSAASNRGDGRSSLASAWGPSAIRAAVSFVLIVVATLYSLVVAQERPQPPVLNGAGSPPLIAQATRSHLLGVIDLYTIALYATPPFGRDQMLATDVAKALRIHVAYQPDLRRPPLVNWHRELVPSLESPATVAHLHGAFAALRRDDIVLIEYTPGKGTSIRVNQSVAVSGAHHELMLAFLDHWLGQRPVSEEIKRRLQGSP